MNFYHVSYLFFALGLKCLAKADEALEDHLDYNNETVWKELHFKLFTNFNPIPTQKVLHILEQLKDYYSRRNDEATLVRAKKIESLLEVSRVSLEKCDWLSFKKINSTIELNWPHFTNVVPYLKHYRAEQFNVCREILVEKMQEVVDGFSDQDRHDISLLMFSSGNPRTRNEKELIQGILMFLSRRRGTLNSRLFCRRKKGKRNFKRVFDEYIGKLCETIKSGLSSWIMVYRQFDFDDLQELLEPETSVWVSNALTCRNIISDYDWLFVKTYKELSRRYCWFGWLCGSSS